jgi:DNA-binding MarR family transcriptional regulator
MLVMSLPSRPLVPGDLSELDEEPAPELIPFLERAIQEGDPRVRTTLRGLLIDRALRVLRRGSRDDLQQEALLVSIAVSGQLGERLRLQAAETFGAFYYLQSLLGEAGRRSDRAAVSGLLRGTRGPAILELLAGENRPMPRSEIRRRLSLGEAQLSHLLRDLEEADLVHRFRPPRSKEVSVELGPVGREVVRSEVLPVWVEWLVQALGEVRRGRAQQPTALAKGLVEAGAPSSLAARYLAEAVAALPASPSLRISEVRDRTLSGPDPSILEASGWNAT